MDEYQRDHIAQLEDRTQGGHTKTTGTWDGGLKLIEHIEIRSLREEVSPK